MTAFVAFVVVLLLLDFFTMVFVKIYTEILLKRHQQEWDEISSECYDNSERMVAYEEYIDSLQRVPLVGKCIPRY